MTITVNKGHLTATEKAHIKAVLEAGMEKAKVNRKTYHIFEVNEAGYTHTVTVFETRKKK